MPQPQSHTARIKSVQPQYLLYKSKLKKANEKIAEGVTDGYKKIEDGVVSGYKKIEEGVVDGFNKMSDKFVDKFLTHEGETVEDAKKRLAEEQAAREEASKEAAEKRAAVGQVSMGAGTDIGRASVDQTAKPDGFTHGV